MQYNFDKIIDRHNTDSLKYDFASKRGKPKDILPLWVADMDFPAPQEVIEALQAKALHGIYGYSDAADSSYFNALYNWYYKRYGWELHPDWILKTPGIVFAICAAIRALTDKGDAILIQEPVYYPFSESVLSNDRSLIVNELVYNDNKYSIDLVDFENKIIKNRVKMFILCSPHNPVGRVWSEAELNAMGEICYKHGIYVVSDEIHSDFVYPGKRHHVFANLKPGFSDITITCTSPTKTFNLAGLQISNIIISNTSLRRKIKQEIDKTGYSQPNLMGLTACKAAYGHGEQWLEELICYLTDNLSYVREFIKRRLPELRLVEPEGTFLAWLDCSGLGLSDKELDSLIVHKAGLWLDAGTMFGTSGSGFQRINIACPREILDTALKKLEGAIDSLRAAKAL